MSIKKGEEICIEPSFHLKIFALLPKTQIFELINLFSKKFLHPEFSCNDHFFKKLSRDIGKDSGKEIGMEKASAGEAS